MGSNGDSNGVCADSGSGLCSLLGRRNGEDEYGVGRNGDDEEAWSVDCDRGSEKLGRLLVNAVGGGKMNFCGSDLRLCEELK